MKKILVVFVLGAFLSVGLGNSVKAIDYSNDSDNISVVFDKDPTKDGGEKSKKKNSKEKCSEKETKKCSSTKNPEKKCGPKTTSSSSKSCCSKSKVSKT